MSPLKVTPSEIKNHLLLLELTPQRIFACTSGLEDSLLHRPPGPRQWSAAEVLAHLRACSELWSHSIYAMLAEDNPILPNLDERRWAKVRGYAGLEFQNSFQAFTLLRRELLGVLENLPELDWSKTALIYGRTHSVFSQCRRLALHEVEHCNQMECLLSQRPDRFSQGSFTE